MLLSIVMDLYVLGLLAATIIIVGRARKHRHSVSWVVKLALGALYILPVWDILPAYALYKYKCATEGGVVIFDERPVKNVFVAPTDRAPFCSDCLEALIHNRLEFVETFVVRSNKYAMAPAGKYVRYSLSHEPDTLCAPFHASASVESDWRRRGLEVSNGECIAAKISSSRSSELEAIKIFNQPVSDLLAVKRSAVELRSASDGDKVASLTYYYYVAGIFRFFGPNSDDDTPTFQCPGGSRTIGLEGVDDLIAAIRQR